MDSTLELDGRTWMVRQSGDLDGTPVVYFHGTPASRLESVLADTAAESLGVRIVCVDRPGYGGSTASSFGLASVAASTGVIADALGLDRFATLGQSGGGPFALACAAVLGDRVTRVGVAAGVIPYQLVPGALDRLDDDDTAALALLPDAAAAAAGLARGFEPFREALQGPDAPVLEAFRARHSARDNEVLEWPGVADALLRSMRESMVAGTSGGGWDNVAWIGPWDIELSDVFRPVDLWYGGHDRSHPAGDAEWLAGHLPDATLHMIPEAGHLLLVEHIDEILTTLGLSATDRNKAHMSEKLRLSQRFGRDTAHMSEKLRRREELRLSERFGRNKADMWAKLRLIQRFGRNKAHMSEKWRRREEFRLSERFGRNKADMWAKLRLIQRFVRNTADMSGKWQGGGGQHRGDRTSRREGVGRRELLGRRGPEESRAKAHTPSD